MHKFLAYSGCPDTEPDDWGISWNATIAGITAFQPCFSSQGTIITSIFSNIFCIKTLNLDIVSMDSELQELIKGDVYAVQLIDCTYMHMGGALLYTPILFILIYLLTSLFMV